MKLYQTIIASCKECPNHRYLEYPGSDYEYCLGKLVKKKNGKNYGKEIKTYPKVPKWCPLEDER